MNLSTVEKAIILASTEKEKGRLSRRLTDKACNIITKIEDLYYEEDEKVTAKVKSCLLVPGLFVTAMATFFTEEVELKNRKKKAAKIFGIAEEDVAGDHRSLVTGKAKKMFVDDFRYDVTLGGRWDKVSEAGIKLRNMEVFWGDTDLRPLHNFKYLESLTAVVGNLYASDAENQEGLNNLEVVTGDFYAGDIDLKNCTSLAHVGGTIYCKGKEMSLSEFKGQQRQYIKL